MTRSCDLATPGTLLQTERYPLIHARTRVEPLPHLAFGSVSSLVGVGRPTDPALGRHATLRPVTQEPTPDGAQTPLDFFRSFLCPPGRRAGVRAERRPRR